MTKTGQTCASFQLPCSTAHLPHLFEQRSSCLIGLLENQILSPEKRFVFRAVIHCCSAWDNDGRASCETVKSCDIMKALSLHRRRSMRSHQRFLGGATVEPGGGAWGQLCISIWHSTQVRCHQTLP